MRIKDKTRGPFLPDNALLAIGAPIPIWDRVRREAARSPLMRFKVGAVVFDNRGILGSGCSNMTEGSFGSTYSVHAEHHALRNLAHLDLDGAWIVLYTLNANGGCAWSSRPCFSCASLLFKRGIARIIYPERLPDNSFILQEEAPEELLGRWIYDDKLILSGWAKGQRIPNA